jgi:hypothetical protein
MSKRRAADRKIIKRYTGEASAMEIRYQILKLILEKKETGIMRAEDGSEKEIMQAEDGSENRIMRAEDGSEKEIMRAEDDTEKGIMQ